jgi:cyclophilin family peptidyl-prolyl cis-trans isomerase
MTIAFASRRALVATAAATALVLGACGRDAPQPVDMPSAAEPYAPVTAPDTFRAAFETSKGPFVVEAYRDWSPAGVDRLYALVENGYFTDVRFFRVVRGFVAQFGMHGDTTLNSRWRERAIPDEPPRHSNERGTITFATAGPDTRSNQLFINLGDNPQLDNAFTPIARVVEGMDVVDQLHSGYGESPNQERIGLEGNAYLIRSFPKLDFIRSARVVR